MGGDEGSRDTACGFEGVNGASRMKRSRSPAENVEREREGKVELELSLGLSTNGRFGVDPARKQMRRSSSVSNMVFNVVSAGNGGDHRARGVENGGHAPLVRTCSAPPDARGWRRRGRSDSVGRLGSEKLKNVDGLHGLEKWRLPKGAIESRGLQSHLVKGATQTTTTGSSSRHPFLDKTSGKEVPTVTVANADVTSEKPLKNALIDMPYVTTRGLGPNHNKIKGFLYKYKKAEEVKIVCVCHGLFLSPAEFVKHGGGSDVDVAYPLKHIVVSPFPLF